MKHAHVDFAPRTRTATWREWHEAVLIGEDSVVIWRHYGDRRSEVFCVLEGRAELQLLARNILRRLSHAKRRADRKRPLRVVAGGRR